MGADQSRPNLPHSGRKRRDKHAHDDDQSISTSDLSLWEAVPGEVLWLVQAQVQQLLQKHAGSLLHRPEQLQTKEDDLTIGAQQELQPHEIKMAGAALRDRKLSPHLQRALDRLVPAQLTEAQFWDNFFSHIDVIKLRIVTDYLQAQDIVDKEKAKRQAEWVAAFDACSLQLQAEPKRAAELIAAQQRPPPPLTVDAGMGVEPPEPTQWVAGGEAWTQYVEHGPHEIFKVLQRTLKQRDAARRDEPDSGASGCSSGGLSSAASSGLKSTRHRSATVRAEAPLLRSISLALEENSTDSMGAINTAAAGSDGLDRQGSAAMLAAMRGAEPEPEDAASPAGGAALSHPLASAGQPVLVVERLQQLGFEEARCREALLKHGGDETKAEDWLLNN